MKTSIVFLPALCFSVVVAVPLNQEDNVAMVPRNLQDLDHSALWKRTPVPGLFSDSSDDCTNSDAQSTGKSGGFLSSLFRRSSTSTGTSLDKRGFWGWVTGKDKKCAAAQASASASAAAAAATATATAAAAPSSTDGNLVAPGADPGTSDDGSGAPTSPVNGGSLTPAPAGAAGGTTQPGAVAQDAIPQAGAGAGAGTADPTQPQQGATGSEPGAAGDASTPANEGSEQGQQGTGQSDGGSGPSSSSSSSSSSSGGSSSSSSSSSSSGPSQPMNEGSDQSNSGAGEQGAINEPSTANDPAAADTIGEQPPTSSNATQPAAGLQQPYGTTEPPPATDAGGQTEGGQTQGGQTGSVPAMGAQ